MTEILVSASTGAMGSVLRKLGIMLRDEYKLLKNVRGDIKFLKAELEAMQAFLIAMAEVERPDKSTKLRVNVVREMSYEIDDNIDKFMILVEREPTSKSDGFMEIFTRSMKKIDDVKTRHKIAKDVKDIKTQVKEISGRYARYKIDQPSRHTNEIIDPRIYAMYKDVTELVGIDGPRDELVKWLSNKDGELRHQPRVVSVVGCGGLGKTTLARQVYDKLGAKYDCRVFVSISRSPNMTQILISILSQLHNQTYVHAGPDPRLIIDEIRGFLEEKRYFVVIDDIWDIETWRTLDCALFKNSCDSAIMITTRIHDVAKSCCSSRRNLVYKIQPLSIADSERLFFKRTFGYEEKCPSNLIETTKDILKKCGGLPLAINAISSLLATRQTKEEWDSIRSSIRFAQGKNSDINTMNYILSLSYFDLPLHLRSCLLHLTMFPEDHEIPRQTVVLLWISEGFVYSKDGDDLVKLGDTYFYDLVNRSLIQPLHIGDDGKAWGCRVHDIVLDFLIYKSDEQNFSTLLRKPLEHDNRVRRLSLMGNEDEGSIKQLDLSHARSLICFRNVKLFPSFTKSNTLRVLDLDGCHELRNHHLKDIGRFFQLRYLNIHGTNISELPRQVGYMKCLLTLNVRLTKLVELPESVTRLHRLVRLFVNEETKFPDGIGNMKKLQELGEINPSKQSLNFVEELGKLTNLKTLDITWKPSKSCGKTSLKEENMVLFFSSLHKLETCSLATTSFQLCMTEDDAALISHAFFPALTSIRRIYITGGKLRWIRKLLVSLVNIETLLIGFGVKIEQQDIEILRSIPTLLDFGTVCGTSEPIIISSGGFQRLHTLDFCVLNELVFETGAMPNLKELKLRIRIPEFKTTRGGHAYAGSFDFGIHHLSSLSTVCVRVNCFKARVSDVEAAEDAIKRMVDAHPNHPMLDMQRDGSTVDATSYDE